MKKFIIKLLVFSLITFFISVFVTYIVYKIIDKGNYYKIDITKENIVFGHSHSETAFDDKIIEQTLNLSNGGESTFYTYFKVKKIIENNKSIKRIFVSFSNLQVDIESDQVIWKDKYIDKWFTKYGAFMSHNDLKVLAKNNIEATIKVQSQTVRDYLLFIAKRDSNIIKSQFWGRFAPQTGTHFDTLKLAKAVRETESFQYSKVNLKYLRKIVQLCRKNNIKFYLVRLPVHKSWGALKNEIYFQKLISNSFEDVKFLDFKNFPLLGKDFLDEHHLNKYGAIKFSTFFNQILNSNIIDKDNSQTLINQKMQ